MPPKYIPLGSFTSEYTNSVIIVISTNMSDSSSLYYLPSWDQTNISLGIFKIDFILSL